MNTYSSTVTTDRLLCECRKIIQLLAVATILLMVFGLILLCVTDESSADNQYDGYCGAKVRYHYEDGTLTISGTGPMEDYAQTNSYSTSGIPWYGYKNEIEVVVIGEGVTSIGGGAFIDCTNLNSVSIPDSVTSIGDHSFAATGIHEIIIPDSLTYLGWYAFQSCVNLESITLPSTVDTINTATFAGCHSLNEVILPYSIKLIDTNAFLDCPSLESIVVPKSVNNFGQFVFGYCYNLKTVYNESYLSIQPGSESNGYVAYYADEVIGNISMQNVDGLVALCNDYTRTAKYMGSHATVLVLDKIVVDDIQYTFDAIDVDGIQGNCRDELRSLTLGEGFKAIDAYTFQNFSQLQTVQLPNSLETIGEYGFCDCNALSSITFGSNLLAIDQLAFFQCTSLSEVILPNSLLTIGPQCFQYCYNLQTVFIPGSVKVIPWNCFSGCTSLSEVTMNDGTSTIEYYSFYQCSFSELVIVKTITEIQYNAFDNNSNLKTIYNYSNLYLEKGSTDNGYVGYYADNVYNVIIDGQFEYIKDAQNNASVYKVRSIVQEMTIPSTITNNEVEYEVISICDSAFLNNESLISITLPVSLETIGNYSFSGCSSLTSVVLPSNLISVGSYAFSGCYNLRSLTIGDSVITIGDNAFYGCNGVTSIVIGDSLTSLNNLPIGPMLRDVTIGGSIEEIDQSLSGLNRLTAVVLMPGVRSISDSAFDNCVSLTSVTLPNTLESIGIDAFRRCSKLSTITIPEGVTVISNGCFASCSKLTSVTMHDGITEIGSEAFYSCSKLTSFEIPDSVISIGNSAFCFCYILASISFPNGQVQIGNQAFLHCEALASITSGGRFTSVGDRAFEACSRLSSLTVSGSIGSIGNRAFYDCTSLSSVVSLDGIISIGDLAFYHCPLSSIYLPESLEWLGSECITSTTMIYIPSGILYYYDDSFSNLTFYDTDGVTILDKTDMTAISGHYYSGSGKLVRDNFLVSYIIDGVLESKQFVMYDNSVDVYSKPGYTIQWTTVPVVEISDGKFTMPFSSVYFYGITTPIKYQVKVNLNGGLINEIPDGWALQNGSYVKELDYGTAATSIEYEFRSAYKTESTCRWVATSDNVTTNGLEIDAVWSANRYEIRWLNEDGTFITSTLVEYGTIPAYSGETPVKESTTTISYTFSGWSPELEIVTGSSSYTAQYSESTRLYNIRFSVDGSITQIMAEYGTMPAAPSNPVKMPTMELQYSFSNWYPTIQNVTTDTTYTAIFSSSPRVYSINWLNYDSSVIRTDFLPYGSSFSYTGDVPTRASTQQYTFTFTGWDRDILPVSNDASYVAQYSQSTRLYTVTWMDDLGTELYVYKVPYGQIPSYSNADPTKQSTAEYRYTFRTWSPVITAVTGDVTYTAVYSASKMSYPITWRDYDGAILLTINNVEYGTIPTYTGIVPSRNPTSQYAYEFIGWTPSVVAVTGATTYTAQYSQTIQTYTVTWLNDDGSVLSRQSNNQYGIVPAFQGTPVKNSTAQYEYAFVRWSPTVVSVNGDATYTAVYDRSVRSYNVVWKNYDGSILEMYENVLYGAIPTYNGDTPAKPGTESERFIFSGWSPSVVEVTGNVSYTATYASSDAVYTITWRNSNGSVLKIDRDVRYGTTPTYGEDVPFLPSDSQYEYSFNGWIPQIAAVTDDAEYVALYDRVLRTYTVEWYDDLGHLLLTDNDVAYGSRPSYSGGQLSKDSTAEYCYTFAGWSPQVTAVLGNASYTAVFTQEIRKYTITWRDSEGNLILVDANVIYGSTPSFSGLTPTKLSTAEFKYSFAGWTPAIETVSGNAEYRATFTSEKQRYAVTWKNYDGNILDVQDDVEYGTIPVYVGNTPSRANTAQHSYAFIGWSPAVVAITGNTTYTAAYSETVNSYIITWRDESGHVLDVQNLNYGSTPEYSGEIPTKDADVRNTYVFSGWNPAHKTVSESATYTAVFSPVPNTYTITWCDENGTPILSNEGLVYGSMPSFPGATPTKASTAEYRYSFSGWYPAVSAVTGNASYNATFVSGIRDYTVTWKDESGTVLGIQSVGYGMTPAYTGTEPSKQQNDQYSYYFNGWSPAVTAVTSDITYTAVYGTNTRTYSVSWLNYDGSTIEYDRSVEYGSHPMYDGDTPERPEVGYNAYKFVRWMNYSDATTVTGDMSFTAVYEEYQVIFEIFFNHYDGSKTMITYRLSSPVIFEPDAYIGVPKGCAAYWMSYSLDGRPNNNVSLVCNPYLDFAPYTAPAVIVSSGNTARLATGDNGSVIVTGTNSELNRWYEHLGEERFIEIPDITLDGKSVAAVSSVTDAQATSVRIGTNVQEVKDGAFSGCTSLKEFVVDNHNNYLSAENGVLMADSGKRLLCVADSAGDTVQIPASVNEVVSKSISGNTKVLVIDSRNSSIVFEEGANSTGSDIELQMASDGHVIEMSSSKLSAMNSGMELKVKSIDYFGEDDRELVIAVAAIIVALLLVQIVSVALVRNVHNTNTWLFLMPTAVSSMIMFVYMLYETVTSSMSTFFTVSVFAWVTLMFVELGTAYYAYICANRSKGTTTIHKRGRILTYAGAAIGMAIAIVTAVLAYFNKIYVYENAIAPLIIAAVGVALICVLAIIVSRKIFEDVRLRQGNGI